MEQINSFGSWLRQRRRALDLTQDAVARQVGYTTATIKKIEQGERRPSRALAARLADVLQVPAEQRETFLGSARGLLAADRLASVASVPADAQPAACPVTNLPVQRERLIGREHEVEQVRELLLRPDVGLVTLTGPGGVGETRQVPPPPTTKAWPQSRRSTPCGRFHRVSKALPCCWPSTTRRNRRCSCGVRPPSCAGSSPRPYRRCIGRRTSGS